MNLSVYIHIPFCVQRCGYCDFNTYAGLDHLISPYVKALCREIEIFGQSLPETMRNKVHTIYLGGGTPSLLKPRDLQMILSTLEYTLGFMAEMEISLEANPGTCSLQKIRGYVGAGVNRLSIGMQSANEHELRLLGRSHTVGDVVQAVEIARAGGIENINLDLINALPNQTLDDWRNSLKVALSLDVEHLSLYSLTIEENTMLYQKVSTGELLTPDDDIAADCYDVAREMLSQAGYLHYEISNWARRNIAGGLFECRHNLQYWKNLPYLGLGAGAHSYLDGYRLINVTHPWQYIQKLSSPNKMHCAFPFSPATQDYYIVSPEEQMRDTLLLGLRLVQEGVGEEDFFRRYGKKMSEVFAEEIHRLLQKGLVEWIEDGQKRIRLTRFGQLLGNQAFIEFV